MTSQWNACLQQNHLSDNAISIVTKQKNQEGICPHMRLKKRKVPAGQHGRRREKGSIGGRLGVKDREREGEGEEAKNSE